MQSLAGTTAVDADEGSAVHCASEVGTVPGVACDWLSVREQAWRVVAACLGLEAPFMLSMKVDF